MPSETVRGWGGRAESLEKKGKFAYSLLVYHCKQITTVLQVLRCSLQGLLATYIMSVRVSIGLLEYKLTKSS